MSLPRDASSQRSHVDDPSLPLSQMLQGLARNQKRPACVGGKNRIPLLHGQLIEFYGFVVGGVVDQDIDSSQFPDRSLIAALTLFSSVISHRNATARPPKLPASITVCCASRAEFGK